MISTSELSHYCLGSACIFGSTCESVCWRFLNVSIVYFSFTIFLNYGGEAFGQMVRPLMSNIQTQCKSCDVPLKDDKIGLKNTGFLGKEITNG